MSDTSPRIGLVGAGGIAYAHMPGLLRLGSVVVYAQDGAPELAANDHPRTP